MDNLPGLIRRSRIVPILLAGGAGFIFQLGIFELFGVYWAVISPSLATVIGGEIGILINFFINDRVSFGHHTHKLPLWERLLRHQGVVLVALGIQWTIVHLTELTTADVIYLNLALFAGIGISLVWNAIWYHLFVWKRHSPPEL